nr:uncharacterized protein LOC112037762 [Quercus suber]
MELKAGYATQTVKFDNIMESIKQVEIKAIRKNKKVMRKNGRVKDYLPYTYLMSKSVDMWTQSHDGGRRFGVMITNILECFNGVLKGARCLLIAEMVEFIWFKLVAYFHDRYKEITHDLLEGKRLSAYAMSTYLENMRKSEKHYVRSFSNERMRYKVITSHNIYSTGGGNHSYEVQLLERTCSCGKWKNIKIPCSHAIRICDVLNIDSTIYIHPCYSLEYAINTYSHAFAVPKSESM